MKGKKKDKNVRSCFNKEGGSRTCKNCYQGRGALKDKNAALPSPPFYPANKGFLPLPSPPETLNQTDPNPKNIMLPLFNVHLPKPLTNFAKL